MSSEPQPDVMVTTKPKSREQAQTRRLPPYHVILENDDFHSFEFVVGVLIKTMGFPIEKAVQLTLQAHNSGRAIVLTTTKEHAEFKADQIQTFHETRESDGKKLGPLGCVIEPAN
jgi:ATP-dependent Clp protease adaptor protein ClpS